MSSTQKLRREFIDMAKAELGLKLIFVRCNRHEVYEVTDSDGSTFNITASLSPNDPSNVNKQRLRDLRKSLAAHRERQAKNKTQK